MQDILGALILLSLLGLVICVLALIVKAVFKKGPNYKSLFKAGGFCLVVFTLSFIFFPPSHESQQSSIDGQSQKEIKNEAKNELTEEKEPSITYNPKNPHPGIGDDVTPLESSVVVIDGIEIKIIGIDYGEDIEVKRKGNWKSSDNRDESEIAIGSFAEGFGSGLAQAILGTDSEEQHMDGKLILYFEMVNKNPRPRNPEIPIKIVDDKGTEYTIYKSMQSFGHGPMKPEEKYLETVSLKAYSDAEYFQVKIGDALFTINAPKFKSN